MNYHLYRYLRHHLGRKTALRVATRIPGTECRESREAVRVRDAVCRRAISTYSGWKGSYSNAQRAKLAKVVAATTINADGWENLTGTRIARLAKAWDTGEL